MISDGTIGAEIWATNSKSLMFEQQITNPDSVDRTALTSRRVITRSWDAARPSQPSRRDSQLPSVLAFEHVGGAFRNCWMRTSIDEPGRPRRNTTILRLDIDSANS
jgi:hypothetical protein